MIAAMSKLTFLFTVVLVGFCGCGGQSETAKPPAAPASEVGGEPPAPEAAQPANPEVAQPAPATTEASKPEGDQAKAAKAEGTQRGTVLNANASEKKSCANLKKDVCKVTLGCAWSTTKKCIDQ